MALELIEPIETASPPPPWPDAGALVERVGLIPGSTGSQRKYRTCARISCTGLLEMGNSTWRPACDSDHT